MLFAMSAPNRNYTRKSYQCLGCVSDIDVMLQKLYKFKITSFSKIYVTSEGAVSNNVLYHQPLPITRHQERFYANNYFE